MLPAPRGIVFFANILPLSLTCKNHSRIITSGVVPIFLCKSCNTAWSSCTKRIQKEVWTTRKIICCFSLLLLLLLALCACGSKEPTVNTTNGSPAGTSTNTTAGATVSTTVPPTSGNSTPTSGATTPPTTGVPSQLADNGLRLVLNSDGPPTPSRASETAPTRMSSFPPHTTASPCRASAIPRSQDAAI